MAKRSYSNDPTHGMSDATKAAIAKQNNDAAAAAPIPIQNPLEGTAHGGMILLATILDRRDGWLRIVPDGDGKVCWFKWKFTTGPWAGFYAMVRGERDQHGESLRVLARKLNDIDGGFSKPTRDSYYDQG